MAIDPRNYDLDELRAASGGPQSVDTGHGRADDATPDEGDGRETARPSGLAELIDAANGAEAPDLADALGETSRSQSPDRPAAAAAFESAVTQDLLALDRAAEDVERPYLPALPATLTAEALIFEWLEFLFLQAGRESVADAMAFYESVGWIGADAAEALDAYLSGLDDPRANADNELDADDHRVSLRYIARLSALRRR
ncbi:MAG: FlaD/FlaE family flagellar protein [Haloplanus sp.]